MLMLKDLRSRFLYHDVLHGGDNAMGAYYFVPFVGTTYLRGNEERGRRSLFVALQ
jgi:hypothetical protein